MICPKCKKEIKMGVKDPEKYYNWQCPYCYNFIILKGNFKAIWRCDTGTYKKQ